MTLVARIKSFVFALVFRRRVEREMSDEWQFHLHARIADLVASGLPPPEAAVQAQREFGDPLRWRECGREARGLRALDDFRSDVAHAVRQFRRAPLFAVVAIVAIAIGVGANTAIFTVVNATLIERLPFKDPQRLVVVWEINARRPQQPNTVGPANYLRWKERVHNFEEIAGVVDSRVNLTGSGTPEELIAENVTDGFFQALGAPPILGRTFSAAESADRIRRPSSSPMGSGSGASAVIPSSSAARST